MREGQINSLRQAEELLVSAQTNPHHLELSKYLVRNMNSIEGAIKQGWTKDADEHDSEYMEKYLELRNKYAPELFPESRTNSGLYHPSYSKVITIEAIKSGFDFSNENGRIIKGMIQSNYGVQCNNYHTKEFPESAAEAREVLDTLSEVTGE